MAVTETADLRYFTAREVARLLRLGDTRVLKLIREGRIRAIREGRSIRVSADAIRDFENNASIQVIGQGQNGDAAHTA